MGQSRRQKAISASYFVMAVAVLELMALIALVVAWVYLYGEDSNNLILLGLFHVVLLATIPLAFLAAYQARAGAPGDTGIIVLYIVAEVVNLVSSSIGLAFRIVNYFTCSSDAFCSDPDGLGLFVTTMMLCVTCVIIVISIIGIFSGAYIYYAIDGEQDTTSLGQLLQMKRQGRVEYDRSAGAYFDPHTKLPVFKRM